MSTINSNTVTLNIVTPPPPAVASAVLTLDSNPVSLGQGDAANVQLLDASGNTITQLPANASITYSSSDSTIATILANGNTGNPLRSQITPIQVGSVSFNASITQ